MVEAEAVLVRGHAERVARQQPLMVVFLGIVLIQVGQLLNTDGGMAWLMVTTMSIDSPLISPGMGLRRHRSRLRNVSTRSVIRSLV